jgi:hypothetical protein
MYEKGKTMTEERILCKKYADTNLFILKRRPEIMTFRNS